MIIEGICNEPLTEEMVNEYLTELSKKLNMTLVMGPLTRNNPKYGISSYIYWEESGTHLYYWNNPEPCFSVDIYSCKKYNYEDAVNLTKEKFNTKEIVWKVV